LEKKLSDPESRLEKEDYELVISLLKESGQNLAAKTKAEVKGV
jgi:hypothetical protein